MKNKNIDLSLYLVTERKGIDLPIFYDTILEAINGGVSIVQLREKETSQIEFLNIAKDLLALLEPLRIPLIINDSIEIAYEIGADGVHLGQSDSSIIEARNILGPDAIIGLSIETLDQMKIAESMDLDYIAASPVFSSITKIDTSHPWGLEGLAKLCMLTKLPVISIGGINIQNVKDVMIAGSSGIGVVSAIFDSKSPRKMAQKLLNKVKQFSSR